MKDEIKKMIRVSFSLAKVNFRLRIENSYLGIFWYLLNPLIMFGILLLVKKAAFPEASIPYYPLFLIIGISAFNFFKQAISESIG
jgi:ABC-type polysaccharide/polyol phosphate export permease